MLEEIPGASWPNKERRTAKGRLLERGAFPAPGISKRCLALPLNLLKVIKASRKLTNFREGFLQAFLWGLEADREVREAVPGTVHA